MMRNHMRVHWLIECRGAKVWIADRLKYEGPYVESALDMSRTEANHYMSRFRRDFPDAHLLACCVQRNGFPRREQRN
ncbi:hypothetical protein AB0L20_32365 [Streptomyces albidoflavus]|uniref:hypothetical protein n=1 Tax=Streptomyces albidoflavus TaxID=1886 RepID=UPI00343B2FEB